MQDTFEKIKIAIPSDLAKIIDHDVLTFEFRKKDHSPNRNAFLNRLIVSYLEEFSSQDQEERKRLLSLAKGCPIEGEALNDYIDKILKEEGKGFRKKENYSKSLSFRPTKESIYVIDYIENNLLSKTTLSEYFRRLFSRYCSLPQYQREKILFKDIYHKLEKAIQEKKKVYLSTRFNSGKRNLISPYAFATVQEETFNYLLCKEENCCHSFRLSKIKDVILVDEKADFSEKDLLLFERMKKYGPQYSYQSDESEAEIILTPKGQKYFRSLYVYRPIVDRVEEDHYFFHCSLDQLEQYFSRFGSECYVVKPLRLRRYLIHFHKKAYENYGRQNKVDADDFPES